MFDTNLVASRIKGLRLKENMTQMNLADEMGVSYQAVSNWERGNSMPDISKLEELASIFNCSIDDLLGSTQETEIVKIILKDKTENKSGEINLQDMGKVIPILQPNQTNNILEEIILSENKLVLEDIIPLAPFIKEKFLEKLLDKVDIVNNIQGINGLAPFLSENALDKVIHKILLVMNINEIMGLAPFLSEQSLDALVMKSINNDNIEECSGLYPFLSNETLQKVAEIIVKNQGVSALSSIAPFL